MFSFAPFYSERKDDGKGGGSMTENGVGGTGEAPDAGRSGGKAVRRVRLADVAAEAGVAISTVSRVFSDPGRINFQTAEHVREVAERLGYRRRPPASEGRPDASARRAGHGSRRAASASGAMPERADGVGVVGAFPINGLSGRAGAAGAAGSGPAGPSIPADRAGAGTPMGAGSGTDPATESIGSGMIALVVKDTADGISSQILKGAQITAMESGGAVSVIETGNSAQRTTRMLDHLVGKVDGVILATDAPGTDFIRGYARRMPLVVLNRPVEGVASVVPDPRIGVVRALSLFKRYHHTAITYVAGPTASWADQSRWRFLHDIGQRMGFRVNRIGPVHATVEGGYQAALALEGGSATAIVTYNDLIAAGIVLRLTADGVKVPDDVSVIGFDNTLIAPVVTPPITTIRIPRAQLGQVAVNRLLGRPTGAYRNPSDMQVMERLAEYGIRCEEENDPTVCLVDTSIIVRQSVGERRRA